MAFPQGHRSSPRSCQVPRPQAQPPWAWGTLTRRVPIPHPVLSLFRPTHPSPPFSEPSFPREGCSFFPLACGFAPFSLAVNKKSACQLKQLFYTIVSDDHSIRAFSDGHHASTTPGRGGTDLRREGLRAATVRDICRRAGVATSPPSTTTSATRKSSTSPRCDGRSPRGASPPPPPTWPAGTPPAVKLARLHPAHGPRVDQPGSSRPGTCSS